MHPSVYHVMNVARGATSIWELVVREVYETRGDTGIVHQRQMKDVKGGAQCMRAWTLYVPHVRPQVPMGTPHFPGANSNCLDNPRNAQVFEGSRGCNDMQRIFREEDTRTSRGSSNN